MSARRYSFSLMELMVAIGLVGTVAVITIFSIQPLYRSYQFKQEVEQLYELLQELQLDALVLQSDMYVALVHEQGHWKARSSTQEAILKAQTVDLGHVDKIDPVPSITLHANGLVRPALCIKLSRKGEERWVDLSGGHLIRVREKEPPPRQHDNIPSLQHTLQLAKPT